MIQYPDDTVIYASNKKVNEAKILVEKEISIFYEYFQSNHLSLKTGKTELMIFC